VKHTRWASGLSVTADGTGVVAHAGSVAVRLLADRVGLTGGLSRALHRRGFTPGHDRGQVLTDVAVMLAAGGEAIADIDTLRHQSGVLGPVASAPTVWRAAWTSSAWRSRASEARRKVGGLRRRERGADVTRQRELCGVESRTRLFTRAR
jgi:hypothetical protein